jgi:ribosome-associated translation inhibitor RaiA
MKIQFNTDKTINGEERNEDFFTAKIRDGLARFESHISRIEVHIKDENGKKKGFNDILCSLEARIEGKNPIAVTHQADTIELAVSGVIDKLKASLKTILDQIKNH